MKKIVLFLLFFGISAQGASVIEENGAITVSHNGRLKKIEIPLEMQTAPNYRMVLKRKPEEPIFNGAPNVMPVIVGGGANPAGSQGSASGEQSRQPSSLKSMIYRANRLFNERRFEEALNLLDRAEAIAPDDSKVKTMKGSLFYMMGWKKYAKNYWEESLELEPEQPDVQRHLEQLDIEGTEE